MSATVNRRTILMTLTAAAITAACGSEPVAPLPAPLPRDNTYTFQDNFDGPAGSRPDATRWTYDLGDGGWGNNESEVYTNSVANAYQDGESHLIVQVTNPSPGVFNSARLTTRGKFSQLYGSWQASIAIDNVPGCWPAFWFLGVNQPWPACGEIDVMENYGMGYTTGTVWNGTASTRQAHRSMINVDGNFHVYQLDVTNDQVALYQDGHQFLTATPAELSPWPFNGNGGLYALLDIATGGTGTDYAIPDSAVLPARMLVDYVRCWQP